MSELREMADRILAEKLKESSASKGDEFAVFPVTVQFAHVFKPTRGPSLGQTPIDQFNLAFSFSDLPVHLRDRVKVREWRKEPTVPVVVLSSRTAPLVVPTPHSRCGLDTTLDCARHNNIEGDRLLREARVEVLVRKVEFDSYNPYMRGKRVKTLDLMAIRVNVDTMVDTYDMILAELHEEFDGWRNEG